MKRHRTYVKSGFCAYIFIPYWRGITKVVWKWREILHPFFRIFALDICLPCALY